jgi:hypothetical protein
MVKLVFTAWVANELTDAGALASVPPLVICTAFPEPFVHHRLPDTEYTELALAAPVIVAIFC